MAKTTAGDRPRDGLWPIQSLSVEGFKSIDAEQTIEVRPLTILAGANSSGKSSIVQPLLLLKQTLEAPYDPGPLLLNGPNAEFTYVDQLLCKARKERATASFAFGLTVGPHFGCKLHFRRMRHVPLELEKVVYRTRDRTVELREGVTEWEKSPLNGMFPVKLFPAPVGKRWARITRNRCFLDPSAEAEVEGEPQQIIAFGFGTDHVEKAITHAIHVPGLRGNPRRTYPLTPVGERYPGTFEKYVASVISASQRGEQDVSLEDLGRDLSDLGLTWKVDAKPVDDTQVELRVGRLPKATQGGAHDLVSIADVGFGVSQVLPVVVGLLTARPGQLVYLEQPEIHLHPRAQYAMARLLARAAERGVRVVAETHSSILLLGVQSLVAKGDLDPAKVKLHWFKRNEQSGMTEITGGELDEAGRFGDWPEDFDDVALRSQQEYLDAAEKHFAHEP